MQKRRAREKARTFTVQALYQWHFNKNEFAALEAEFRLRNDYHVYVDWLFFHDLLAEFFKHHAEIDGAIEKAAERPLKEINPMELAILQAAGSELKTRLEVPYQVVLAEYVSLSASFGATDAHQFVNAVLERLSLIYRKLERGEG